MIVADGEKFSKCQVNLLSTEDDQLCNRNPSKFDWIPLKMTGYTLTVAGVENFSKCRERRFSTEDDQLLNRNPSNFDRLPISYHGK